jgi:hypothetical protein
VQMTDAYASAVTVSIPIFVLAAGAEARAVRERLKRPDEEWERNFGAYRAGHELNMSGRPSEVIGFMRGAPMVSRLYLAPAAYLLVPLAMPLDLVPKGMREEFKAKLKDEKGARGFFRLALTEFEGAMERAADQLERNATQPSPEAPGPPAPQAPGPAPGPPAPQAPGPAPGPPLAGERPGP